MTTPAADAVPIDLTAVRAQVAASVDRQTAGLADRFATLSPDLAPLGDELVAFSSGGKRIRPLFAYCGWRAVPGSERVAEPTVVDAISALELVQTAALIHDDIIDESLSRRGRPSVHAAFAAAHRDAGLLGDSTKHGTATAILLGDVALVWADEVLHAAGLPPEVLHAVRREFDQMRLEVLAGQYLDVLEQARPAPPEQAIEYATRVAELKSASYTVARPLRIGGLIGGADDRVLDAYRQYGYHVGIGFQLRDDLLGVFGRPEQTGKPAGDDLREGKRTVLVAFAHQRLRGRPEADRLDAIGAPELTAEQIASIAATIEDCGAVDDVEALITEHAKAARDLILDVDLTAAGRDALLELIELATARSH